MEMELIRPTTLKTWLVVAASFNRTKATLLSHLQISLKVPQPRLSCLATRSLGLQAAENIEYNIIISI
jgi:hypothetical protein